jgi:iron complex transport system substrate-binding protein
MAPTFLPLVAAAAGLLLLAGCAGPVDEHAAATTAPTSTAPLTKANALADPKSYVGQSTARLASPAITPVEADPAQSLPAVVQSHDRTGEVKVTVTSTARIVAFDGAGSIASTVYGLGLGDHLVGRDVATTIPGTGKLPLVTSPDGQSINIESVLKLRPTVVVTDGSVGPLDVVQQLRDSHIPVVFVTNDSSFQGASELARQVGAALGVEKAGELLATRISAQITKEVATIAAIAPADPAQKLRMAFLYLRGDSGIFYLFGEGSGAETLIDALAGVDAAKEIHWSGMKPMTDEALVAMNPDLILVMTDGLKSVGGVDGLLQKKPAVGLTSAGRNKRFVDMADGEILSFGPRSADVLGALARAVYAP